MLQVVRHEADGELLASREALGGGQAPDARGEAQEHGQLLGDVSGRGFRKHEQPKDQHECCFVLVFICHFMRILSFIDL